MRQILFAVPLLTLLAGCAAPPSAPSSVAVSPPPRAECAAEAVQARVGAPWREALRASLLADSGATQLRLLRPGMAATLDYRADRLNVRLDAQSVIVALDCG